MVPSVDPGEVQVRLDSAFEFQRTDPDWSGRAERSLSEHLQALLPTGGLGSIECRATVCRFKMRCETVAQYQAFIDRLAQHPESLPWDGSVFVAPATDSGSEENYVAYLGRAGMDLQDLIRE